MISRFGVHRPQPEIQDIAVHSIEPVSPWVPISFLREPNK